MTRILPAALALACVTLLGACNASDISAAIPPGVTPVSVQSMDLTVPALQAAGIPDRTIVAAQTKAAQVQRYAVAACGAVPTLTTVAGLFLAAKPGFATAKQIASTACAAITGRPTYAALGSRRGEVVTATVAVNGWPIRVEMTRVR